MSLSGPRRAARIGRPSSRYVLERGPCRPPEQADPFLAALAQDPDLAAAEIERAEAGRRQLADPQAGRVGRLDNRPVAQRQGRRHVAAAGLTGRRSIDRREQPLDLLDLEDPRQATGHPGVAIAPHGSPSVQPLRVVKR